MLQVMESCENNKPLEVLSRSSSTYGGKWAKKQDSWVSPSGWKLTKQINKIKNAESL